jgi:hypothetical protein
MSSENYVPTITMSKNMKYINTTRDYYMCLSYGNERKKKYSDTIIEY